MWFELTLDAVGSYPQVGWATRPCARCVVGCEDRMNAAAAGAEVICRPFSRARMNEAYADESGRQRGAKEARLGFNGGAILIQIGRAHV